MSREQALFVLGINDILVALENDAAPMYIEELLFPIFH